MDTNFAIGYIVPVKQKKPGSLRPAFNQLIKHVFRNYNLNDMPRFTA
jgi:hypothetical protein